MDKTRADENRQRLLEEKLAFQQHQLDELNGALVEQRGEIDKLQQDLAALVGVVRGLIDRSGEELPHEKPPHY